MVANLEECVCSRRGAPRRLPVASARPRCRLTTRSTSTSGPASRGRRAALRSTSPSSRSPPSPGSPADVDAAVRAAQRALPSWSATSREARLAMLEQRPPSTRRGRARWPRPCREHPSAWLRAQAAAGLAHLRQFVRVLRGFEFEQPLRAGELLTHEPIGVCARCALERTP